VSPVLPGMLGSAYGEGRQGEEGHPGRLLGEATLAWRRQWTT
jgi:hypothetical protein